MAFMVEYKRDGNRINSRRITASEAKFMIWMEELIADPHVHDITISHPQDEAA